MLCVFDVNETLLDLAALDEFFADLTGAPEARREWFGLLIHSALTLTAARRYRPFGEIAAVSLPAVAARYGCTATAEHQRELGARLRRLPPHPDAADALKDLRDAGFAVVTLTNSTLEVAEDQVRNAGLRDLLDGVYSADEVSMLKPAPEPYRHVLERRHASPADAVLIAAHDWDVAGAAAAGMRSAFIAREGHVPLPAVDAPTVTSDSLRGIAAELTRLETEQNLGNRSPERRERRLHQRPTPSALWHGEVCGPGSPGRRSSAKLPPGGAMKKLVELLLCILHPLAVVLMWINLASRADLTPFSKIVWAIFGLIPLVPFLYVLTGGDLF